MNMNPRDELKRQAMNTIKHTETVAQVGAVKMTGGIALYLARIREADRQAGTAPRPGRKHAFGRQYE
jgi:hypothetical protein